MERRLVRADPADKIVIGAVLVRVFNGYRGFTDTAEALQRLRQ